MDMKDLYFYSEMKRGKLILLFLVTLTCKYGLSTLGRIAFWRSLLLRLLLSPNFYADRPKISQEMKSFFVRNQVIA